MDDSFWKSGIQGQKNGRASGNRIEQKMDFSSGRLYGSRHNWGVWKGEDEYVGEEGETNSSSYWNIDVNLLYLTSETLMLWMKLCRGGHCRRIRNQKIYSLQRRKTFCVRRFLYWNSQKRNNYWNTSLPLKTLCRESVCFSRGKKGALEITELFQG